MNMVPILNDDYTLLGFYTGRFTPHVQPVGFELMELLEERVAVPTANAEELVPVQRVHFTWHSLNCARGEQRASWHYLRPEQAVSDVMWRKHPELVKLEGFTDAG